MRFNQAKTLEKLGSHGSGDNRAQWTGLVSNKNGVTYSQGSKKILSRGSPFGSAFFNLSFDRSLRAVLRSLMIALPLSAAQGLWQMQVFFGQVLPHECENDVNKTGGVISNYLERIRYQLKVAAND